MSYTIIDHVVYGADEVVKQFVDDRLPYRRGDGFGPSTALGVIRNGRLVGGVVFHCFRGHDLEISIASDTPMWASKKTFARLYAYPFRQLGVARITCITGRKNKPVRRLAGASGFRLEGVHRKALDGVEDAMSYGLLRDDCRWLQYI